MVMAGVCTLPRWRSARLNHRAKPAPHIPHVRLRRFRSQIKLNRIEKVSAHKCTCVMAPTHLILLLFRILRTTKPGTANVCWSRSQFCILLPYICGVSSLWWREGYGVTLRVGMISSACMFHNAYCRFRQLHDLPEPPNWPRPEVDAFCFIQSEPDRNLWRQYRPSTHRCTIQHRRCTKPYPS